MVRWHLLLLGQCESAMYYTPQTTYLFMLSESGQFVNGALGHKRSVA